MTASIFVKFALTHLVILQLFRLILSAPACPVGVKSASEVVGGKVISQDIEIGNTIRGCQWVLSGGSSSNYTFPKDGTAEDCWKCQGSLDFSAGKASFTCQRPTPKKLAPTLEGKCRLHLAVDCHEYLVDFFDTSKPCKYERKMDPCPQLPKIQNQILGGKEISQTLIYLDVPDGRCEWVLLGSSREAYTLAENHPFACASCLWDSEKDSANCTSPDINPSKYAGCVNRLGFDCKAQLTDEIDPTKPCRIPIPDISRSVSRVKDIRDSGDSYEVSAFKKSGQHDKTTASLTSSSLTLLMLSVVMQVCALL